MVTFLYEYLRKWWQWYLASKTVWERIYSTFSDVSLASFIACAVIVEYIRTYGMTDCWCFLNIIYYSVLKPTLLRVEISL